MKIRMLTDVVGPGTTYRSGEVHDLPTDMAKAWLKNGQAEPLAQKPTERAEKRARA